MSFYAFFKKNTPSLFCKIIVLKKNFIFVAKRHQYEKTKQIMNCTDYEQRDQLERQVEMLKKKIQMKTRQIEKVKKYQKSQKVFGKFFV